MERLAKGQPCKIFGDGKQTMDFVYVDDIARANLMAAYSSITDDVIKILNKNQPKTSDTPKPADKKDDKK